MILIQVQYFSSLFFACLRYSEVAALNTSETSGASECCFKASTKYNPHNHVQLLSYCHCHCLPPELPSVSAITITCITFCRFSNSLPQKTKNSPLHLFFTLVFNWPRLLGRISPVLTLVYFFTAIFCFFDFA